ncbi:MAG TPA: YdcF family protein [Pyrinomonadaceae bacterium]|nr:YdcF family protein [Pyrinomonadaceae bacterium]
MKAWRAANNRDGRRARILLKCAVAALLAWPLIAWGAARLLVARAELPRAEAIVVLGGSATYVERARRAAEAYREGRAPKILLTDDGQRGSWSSAEQRNPLFVERAADELKRAGVPAESIEVLPRKVSSTYEEAVLLREYADARGMRSFIIVTSAYHSRRALWTMRQLFRGSGVEVGLEAVAPGDETPAPHLWWLGARGWEMVAGEYVKAVYYWAHYG